MKIAFCLLTRDGLNHPHLWKKYIENNKKFNFYVHHAAENLSSSSLFLKKFVIPEKTLTSWEHNFAAQLLLLKYALKDKDNAKFVFISESCIPLRTTAYVYNFLLTHDKSFVKLSSINKNHIESFRDSYSKLISEKYYKNNNLILNHQWIILNREHASLLLSDENLQGEILNKCFGDNEIYPSLCLFKHDQLNNNFIRDDLTTYVDWKNRSANQRHPYTYKKYSEEVYNFFRKYTIENPSILFARKFAKNFFPILNKENYNFEFQ